MEKAKKKSTLRRALRLIFWVLLLQFVLINVSAFFYAYRFTHIYSAEAAKLHKPPSNVLASTWRLYTGERLYRSPVGDKPDSAFESIHLKTASNLTIEGWYRKWMRSDTIQNAGPEDSITTSTKGTVILFHGYTGNKSVIMEQANQFRWWGYNVMMVDARDHGDSEGNTTTLGYRESEEVKLAYDFVKSKGEKKIYLWGFSMGSVQIMKAIADYKLEPAGIILEMPFLSLQAHVKNRISMQGFPQQPFGFFITFWIGAQRGFNGFSFNTLSYARKINCPVVLQCGARDQLVTKDEADKIYQAISSSSKKMVVYEDANHESLLQKDAPKWRQEVKAFMEEGVISE